MINEITPEVITRQVYLFREFMNASWSCLEKLMENHDWDTEGDFIGDWVQVNWEFLVERELLGPLYRIAPLSIPLRRITCTGEFPDYYVATIFTNETKINGFEDVPLNKLLRLFGFVKALDKGYGCYPPFDYAELVSEDTKHHFNIPIADLSFHLEEFPKN